MKTQLQAELNAYLNSPSTFNPYYKTMKHIVYSTLFQSQLEEILHALEKEDVISAKNFKLYLDTVIINMQTKIAKYKISEYFDGDNVKEIENQGFIIPFYSDNAEEKYVLLGIIKKSDQ